MRKFLIGLVMLFPLIGTAVSQIAPPDMHGPDTNPGVCQIEKVSQLAVAIARTEGFYVHRTIPNRLHNPGDIRSHFLHAYPGQRGLYRGYVVFKSDAYGWAALCDQLERVMDGTSKHYRQEMTFRQFAKKYAEDPHWSKTVCHILNVPGDMTMEEYFELPPRLRLTGADDASKLRLFEGGHECPMPVLRWLSPLSTSLL